MAKAKAGQKRQQQSIASKKQNKKQKQTPLIPDSPPIDEPVTTATTSDHEEGLFDNLDEEMDPSGLDDIVRELEEGSADEEDEESDQDVQPMSEDDQSPSEDEDEAVEQQQEDDERIKKPASKPKFRDHYMGQMTRAFGSDLDKIRQEPTFNASQLPILIDSLQAGVDIFSNLEQEIILADAAQE